MKTQIELDDMEQALRMAVPHMNDQRFKVFVRLCAKFEASKKREAKKEKQVLKLKGNYEKIRKALNELELEGVQYVPEKPRLSLHVDKNVLVNVSTYLKGNGIEVLQ